MTISNFPEKYAADTKADFDAAGPVPGDDVVTGVHSNDYSFERMIENGRKAPDAPGFDAGELKRQSMSEQVCNRILSMIKSGNLKSADQLPTEQQMCAAFGISRPTLREALKALTLMGVLESRQGGRYTVSDLSANRLIAPFNIMLSIPDYDVQKHFEARLVVDLELVRLCAERASAEVCERIALLARNGDKFYDNPVGFRLLDIEFHQAINAGADNPFLSAISEGLYDVALDLRRIASNSSALIRKSTAQHCDVADAICAGDAPAAATAFRLHLEHVRDTTIELNTEHS